MSESSEAPSKVFNFVSGAAMGIAGCLVTHMLIQSLPFLMAFQDVGAQFLAENVFGTEFVPHFHGGEQLAQGMGDVHNHAHIGGVGTDLPAPETSVAPSISDQGSCIGDAEEGLINLGDEEGRTTFFHNTSLNDMWALPNLSMAC